MSKLLYDVQQGKVTNQTLLRYGVGAGLRFDGVNDNIIVGNLPLFQTNNPYNVSFFANIRSDTFTTLRVISGCFSTGFNGGRNIFYYYDGNFNIIAQFYGTNPDTATCTFNINAFVNQIAYYSINFDGSKYTLYVNGVFQPVTPMFYSEMTGTYTGLGNSPTRIGADAVVGNPTFLGDMYDYKVFNKQLNQAEIDKLYETRGTIIPSTATSNILVNYGFNQKQGTVLYDTQGNNGTLINFANTTPSVGNAWLDDSGNSILI